MPTRLILACCCSLLLATEGIDVPLRDAAVCTGPDGTFYLTGTSGTPSWAQSRGAQVWRSTDLVHWQDLGLVWDLQKDAVIGHDKSAGASMWQNELYPIPALPAGVRGRAFTAPRLAHDGERFWLTYSMCGYAAGAMPGGATVQGPYRNTHLLSEAGGAPTGRSDASLFCDTDGTRYLVWGGGGLARLKSIDQLSGLQHHEVGITGTVHVLPTLIEGFPGDDGLPDHGAPYGPGLFHDGTRYQFVFTASTLRDGAVHEDSYAASAATLLGPYTRPLRLIPDSGRVVPFRGTDRLWRLAYSDAVDRPQFAPFNPAPMPAVTAADRPGRATIATTVPARPVAQHPVGPPQLVQSIVPCLEHPLRDAALGQGPDGTWYLTGTEAAQAADGTLDWSRNNGVRLWRSPDRQTWTDLGLVWDIDRDAARTPASAWQLEAHLDLTCGAAPRIGRAITAPELHHLAGTFWITYAMNGSGIGLLKSSNGSAEGPYTDLGRLVRHGRDGSLFADGERTYLVWGEGYYAPIDLAQGRLTGPAKALFANVAWYPREMRRPELMGQWGSRLAKQGDWYIWTFTSRSGRGGVNAIDSLTSWSTALDGPWSEPCLTLANGGQSTLVADGAGGWLATVSGEDVYSQLPFQPAITPVVSAGSLPQLGLKPYASRTSVSQWDAAHSLLATELDLGMGWPDLLGTELRDVYVMRDGGTYYACGTAWGSDIKASQRIVLFRSPDMVQWERIDNVYQLSQLKADGVIEDVARFDAACAVSKGPAQIKMGETKIYRIGDRWFILWMCCGGPGIGNYLLESTSGQPQGPYRAVKRLPGPCELHVQEDGGVILTPAMLWMRRFASIDELIATPMKAMGSQSTPLQIASLPNIHFNEDCEMGLERIAGRYVFWSADWTGGYDANYVYADDWQGPYRGSVRVLPHGGNGRFFQAADGGWWYANFLLNTNEWTTRSVAKNKVRLNLMRLHVSDEGGELVIEPASMRANRQRIEAMGALWHGR